MPLMFRIHKQPINVPRATFQFIGYIRESQSERPLRRTRDTDVIRPAVASVTTPGHIASKLYHATSPRNYWAHHHPSCWTSDHSTRTFTPCGAKAKSPLSPDAGRVAAEMYTLNFHLARSGIVLVLAAPSAASAGLTKYTGKSAAYCARVQKPA